MPGVMIEIDIPDSVDFNFEKRRVFKDLRPVPYREACNFSNLRIILIGRRAVRLAGSQLFRVSGETIHPRGR